MIQGTWINISTHTPLAGRDMNSVVLIGRLTISTHTPLAGRDLSQGNNKSVPFDFYSHAPRGARPSAGLPIFQGFHFYSHAPRGARLDKSFLVSACLYISTHTPLAGRDVAAMRKAAKKTISTHTPLAGRDNFYTVAQEIAKNFYSHAPRGARLRK